jgi:hypothetical protein
MLADIAVHDAEGFGAIVAIAKQGLAGQAVATPKADPVVVTKADVKDIKEDLKAELKEEIKAEVQAEIDQQSDLESLTVAELKDIARERGLSGYSSMKKAELIDLLK